MPSLGAANGMARVTASLVLNRTVLRPSARLGLFPGGRRSGIYVRTFVYKYIAMRNGPKGEDGRENGRAGNWREAVMNRVSTEEGGVGVHASSWGKPRAARVRWRLGDTRGAMGGRESIVCAMMVMMIQW